MSDQRELQTSDRLRQSAAYTGAAGQPGYPAAPAPHAFGFPLNEPAAVEKSKDFSARSLPGGLIQIATVDLFKSYFKGHHEIPVLKGVNLEVYSGELLSIVGSSGCGKSTLLHVLGTLDAPDSGEVQLAGLRIDNLPAPDRDLLRNRYFGMVFQFYHLLPELTTLENVLAPLMIGNSVLGYAWRRKKYLEKARRLLDEVGLGHRLKHKPRELSGGEMQRAAIARALITDPEVLLADEPTGNLDQRTGAEILGILRSLNARENLTIVMVTHDESIASQAHRVVRLVQGKVRERE